MDEDHGNEVFKQFCISPEEHNSFVMGGFRDQLVDGKNCDLEIRLKDSSLFVHKCLVDIFFTKIGADLENDRFYLDLKQFPKKLMIPLVDMMYHGVLSVPIKDIPDLRRMSVYVGYEQAKEVLLQYIENSTGATYSEAFTEQNANGFVIKSEPPEDEMCESGLINQPGYIAENAYEENSMCSSKKAKKGEISQCIYEVFTPNPRSLQKNREEITSNLKFKEDLEGLSELIRDKDKTRVTITENPYEVVSEIQKQNELIRKGSESPRDRRTIRMRPILNSEPMGILEVKRKKGSYHTRKEDVETNVDSQNAKIGADRLYNLQKRVDNYIASRSVGVSVKHVQSPGPKANRSTFDGTNEKNFEKAAANRMLQNSIMSVLAAKAKMKPGPGGMMKELKVKARSTDDDASPAENDKQPKTDGKLQEKKETRRKRIREAVNYMELSDSEDEEKEIGDYLVKKKKNKVKYRYFPPAGIVPDGCKSSYAQTAFARTKTITETLKAVQYTLSKKNIVRDEQTPFVCDICGWDFKWKSHFDTHYRIHTGEKPFMCKVCGRSFTVKGNLKSHMAQHVVIL